MALEDYRADMERCQWCSYCKWIPLAQVKSWRFSKGCPSIEGGGFRSYSAGGRLAIGLALLDGRISYKDGFLDIVYKCQMCGMCDIACKVAVHYMEPLEAMRELRFKLIEEGQFLAQHVPIIDNLRKEDNMMLKAKAAQRGMWAEGLEVKDLSRDKADVVFHAGCQASYDKKLWKVVKSAVNLLKNVGVDIGMMGKNEVCCGGRAYDMGYKGELAKYAERSTEAWAKAGVRTVVTSCSHCYYAFKVLYPQVGKRVEVLHITEYLDMLIKEGKIKFTRTVPIKITYHDPCHLGRLGEEYIPWTGREKKFRNQIVVYEPPKPKRRGANGVYQPPRDVLKSIPGLQLVEMERIREYAWCCGAGAGVEEAYPDFAIWTGRKRVEEARATGAEAIVTACTRCESNFLDAFKGTDETIQLYDIVELVQQAM